MSVTTTDNVVTGAVLQALTDYDLVHSGDPAQSGTPAAPNARTDTAENSNPDWWPTNHRRVPPYRPIDRTLDMEQRPNGVNVPEQVFIFTMLRGVQVLAGGAKVWGATGGYLNKTVFKYKIGGEK